MNKEVDIIDFVKKIGFESIINNYDYSVVATYNGYYKDYKFVKTFTINNPLPLYELYLSNVIIFSSNNKDSIITTLQTIFRSELRKYKINILKKNLEN